MLNEGLVSQTVACLIGQQSLIYFPLLNFLVSRSIFPNFIPVDRQKQRRSILIPREKLVVGFTFLNKLLQKNYFILDHWCALASTTWVNGGLSHENATTDEENWTFG